MLKIKDTALEDRPRERLMKLGAEALSNSELLAISIPPPLRSQEA